MGEEPRTSRTEQLSREEPPRDQEQIRAEIEETREDLGDTVEALAAKTDVKARAKAKAAGVKETAAAKKDELLGKAREASPESAGQVAQAARENPIPVATLGAFAAGFLVGRLTRR